MRCYVYASCRKADTYVFLREQDDGASLPPPVATLLGPLRFVMGLDLSPGRRLARENPEVVRQNLAQVGFHVQFPPEPHRHEH